jgi:hypothetical protein
VHHPRATEEAHRLPRADALGKSSAVRHLAVPPLGNGVMLGIRAATVRSDSHRSGGETSSRRDVGMPSRTVESDLGSTRKTSRRIKSGRQFEDLRLLRSSSLVRQGTLGAHLPGLPPRRQRVHQQRRSRSVRAAERPD